MCDAETEHNIDWDGWGRKETGMGTGGAGSQSLRERVEKDGCNFVKGAGTGGDGVEIPSLHRPAV